MATRLAFDRTDGTRVEIAATTTTDGDFHIDAPAADLVARRAAVMDGSWAVVRQVHGRHVVEAEPGKSPEADGVYTAKPLQPIAVQGADCAPIALFGPTGSIGVVHAGWRGLAAGIVPAMVNALRGADVPTVDRAVVGPFIGPECYEFGANDLDGVAAALGDAVRGRTANGSPALDLGAGIVEACSKAGVKDIEFIGACTSCTWDGYSHRARQDHGRHAMVARIVPEGYSGE